MGAAFAQRLRAAGWEVIGFDLAPTCQQRARKLGVELARDNAAVFARCDRVLLSLPTLRETKLVLREARHELRPGQLLLDTTTGEPEQTVAIHRRLAALGVRYPDKHSQRARLEALMGETDFWNDRRTVPARGRRCSPLMIGSWSRSNHQRAN